MGQTASSVASKLTHPLAWMLGKKSENPNSSAANCKGPPPFVYKRQGSMFFDEDGDLAHEFFEEVRVGKRYVMRKKYRNLKPQGEVELSHPRINTEIPVVMCEALMTTVR